MREKLFKKGTMRRLFSIVLALAMVLSLMPMNAQLVYAAGGSKTVTIDTVIPKEELDSKYDQRTFYDEDKIISIRNTRNPLCLSNGIRVTSGEGAAGTPLAISSLPGYTITKIEVTIGMSTASVEDGTFLVAGDKKVQVNGLCLGKSFAIDGLNSESLTVTTTGYTLMLKQIKVTFTVPNHTHNYESGWTSNDDYHWHACTGEGNTESCILMTKGAKEPHTGGTATCYSKKVCSVCGREYGELLPHNYEYTATGNVLTATCQNPGCSKSESLTLSPKYYSGEAANISKATILGDAGFDDFNSKIDNNLSESNFKIYNYADVEKDNEITGNITQKGIYIAELSKDGQTADIAFDVYQNHKHDLVYEAIGDTLIAYCNAEPADHVVNCDIVGEKASVTLTVDPEIHTGITVDVAKSTIFENTNFAAYNEKLGEKG
ncbi:MAG: hypothetical protein Q4D76_18090 [Oscillospiraceae bacterium]|nr:hypothetical protein [Oscillospiraceae bacterium]